MSIIQTVILAGGQSSRMHGDRPKAFANIAGRPIIDHLISRLASQGLTHISIALGSIQKPFVEHFSMPVQSPAAGCDFRARSVAGTNVQMRLLDTGAGCDTGGRLGRMAKLLSETFVLCWCDGLWDVNVNAVLRFNERNPGLVTVLAVHPPGRFGRLELDGDTVTGFLEKPVVEDEWVSGGLFVIEPGMLELISNDRCSLENDVLPVLARNGQLSACRHEGFWHCIDTPADQSALDQLLRGGISA